MKLSEIRRIEQETEHSQTKVINKQKGQPLRHLTVVSPAVASRRISFCASVSAVPCDQRVRGEHQLLLLLREQGDGTAALGKWQPAAESQRPHPRGKRTDEDKGGGRGGHFDEHTGRNKIKSLSHQGFFFFSSYCLNSAQIPPCL